MKHRSCRSIGKTKATSIYHEWQTDSLQAPGNSKVSEGLISLYLVSNWLLGTKCNPAQAALGDCHSCWSTHSQFVGPNRARLGNYAQINGKTIAVSGTRRAIDQAGVADEYAYQLKKRGTELRRDLEFNLIMITQSF